MNTRNSTPRSSAKILVSYHKPATLIKNDVFVPIHVGRALGIGSSSKDGTLTSPSWEWLLANTIGDDTGDNISLLNRNYCELTAIYWAWKNYDQLGNPDYCGLIHYRRFISVLQESDRWGMSTLPYLTDEDVQLHFDAEKIQEIIGNYDIYANWRKVDEYPKYTEGEWFEYWYGKPIMDLTLRHIQNHWPAIYKTAHEYLDGHECNRCNLMVCKKELFFEWCSFLFNVLEEINKHLNYDDFSELRIRFLGCLAERLTGMWLYAKISEHKYKIRKLIRVKIEDTSLPQNITSVFPGENIPIILSCDDTYARQCGVTLQSLINNSNNERHYDIVILHTKLSDKNKGLLLNQASNHPNISVRFYNMTRHIGGKNLHTTNSKPLASYCKLYIANILQNYNKVIYLDSDTIVCRDIADMYDIQIGDAWVAAVRDYDLMARFRLKDYTIGAKWPNNLNIDDLFTEYHNSGVLLLNLSEMRNHQIGDKLIDEAEHNIYDHFDQDILNKVCRGHILSLDSAWNVIHDAGLRKKGMARIPAKYYRKWLEKDRSQPSIVHYVGSDKPWKNPNVDMASLWWSCARQTAFYEEIVYIYLKAAAANHTTKTVAALDDKLRESNTAHHAMKIMMQDVLNYSRIQRRYFLYRFASHITFGKLKQNYWKKKRELKTRLVRIREFLHKS